MLTGPASSLRLGRKLALGAITSTEHFGAAARRKRHGFALRDFAGLHLLLTFS
jgi:hypothetical protein